MPLPTAGSVPGINNHIEPEDGRLKSRAAADARTERLSRRR
jgi:hypothetical protein